MASRPRRAAAQKANTAITDMVDSDNITSSRTGKIMSSRAQARRSEGKTAVATITRGPPSSPSDSNQHIHVTVKLPASKLRQATSSRTGQSSGRVSLTSRENFEGGEILEGKRSRNQKKSYVVESSEDDDAEGEDEDAPGEDEDMMDLGDDDAEGEIVVDDSMDLDIDAEGEEDDDLGDEDAEGEEDDMTIDVTPPIKLSKPASSKSTATSKAKPAAKPALKQVIDDENSDDELSELESEDDDIQDTVKVGGGDDDDEDAEGEDEDELEIAGAADQDDDEELLSDDDGSRAATPDFSKMTKRQRARFEDDDGTLLKLSDEVQAKKHFTAEELSMRRAEMARRRRNLSEKRNEEIKAETINKLLKKQAPKTNKKSQLGGDGTLDGDSNRPNPIFVRWVSTKDGNRVSVPEEILAAPAGRVFIPGGLKSGKMVEEVS
ncbi:PAPA-1-like conserved region-domain-containing protein [Truncatella angustata]|uniref:PAPA-1-like conserved region-domain-containing protein n=1 Tax=Truncatella angustata TaxID=152316 RepID=A0A9P9A0R8_9PEZI|nr:PAPA-1-like conserved region-domain-containing protein [Truncatella angustata]KAH6656391.1 PAPA-1-like conserved region-domain-containing protein [Truncatella angustata]KAH8196639.1 hypothetical protein TruAng_009198 [Truncatella angustata]